MRALKADARSGGVAVVTGGTAGVGRATAIELARHGWDVAVIARGEAGLRATEGDVADAGRRGLGVSADVSDLEAVRDAARRIEAELGPIELWVNVAFVGALRFFWDTDPATFRRITDVTYYGQVNGTRVALELMRPRNRGVIVNVSSALAYRGIPLQSAYCAAKHAVKGFTESVVTELRHERSRVRVCLATLPGLNTPQFDWNDNAFDGHPRPVAPVFQPETAARAVRFLAEHPRRNMWIGVSSAYTVLGNRIAPALLDRYLAKTGVKGQLTDHGPRLGSNVFEPRDSDGDRGAHGMFDDEAHARDPWGATSMAVWGAVSAIGSALRRLRRPMTRDADGFAPIESYAAIGDGRTVALVADDGQIDWWPVPAMDAPPTFAAILDPARGGYVELTPVEPFSVSRRYLPDTNVLETTFTTEQGAVRVIDALPVGRSGRLAWSELVRHVEALHGTVAMGWAVAPGSQLGTASPWIAERGDTFVIRVGEDQLVLRLFDVGEPVNDGHRISGTFTPSPGRPGLLAVVGASDAPVFLADRAELEGHLEITERHWREWSSAIAYDGPWQDAVRRSAFALRLLQYVPTGAVSAAPTTSLPEVIGGSKNWDYRFMWVRDCALTIDAFLSLQLNDEAQAAVQWMLGALRRTAPDLHVCYRLDGSAPDAEEISADVPGYRSSSPVRIGNGAATQLQLGTFGDLFDMIWRYVDAGHCLDPKTSRLLADLADRCCDTWRQEDAGMWEMPTRRHYTISKIGCWTALDRAVRLHEADQLLSDHVDRWAGERDRMRAWIEEHCWSQKRSAYVGYAGADGLDAATLLMARTDFDTGERLAETVTAIRKELAKGPLVRRYSGADDEGGFVACTFWLVQALVRLGDLPGARDLMDEAVGLVNDVGLLSEIIDPKSGEMLGNFPQGLSHLALINAACAYDRAR